eukprot:1156675-Pelagomonas_calceolata.AAC.6
MTQGLSHSIIIIINGMAEKPKNLDEKELCQAPKRVSWGCSSSAGIVGRGPAGRPCSVESPGPILGGQYGCGLAGPTKSYLFSSTILQARSPCSSHIKLVAGVMALCKPASSAL